MPAKGWRKDERETNFDTVLSNANMSIDSFLFPRATINKLAKQILAQTSQHPMLLAKDSQIVIQRGAVMFVNFIYHHAKQLVKQGGRKVVNAEDVIKALGEVGFSDFVPVLNDELEKFVKIKENKKLMKQQAKKSEIIDEDIETSNKRMRLDHLMNSVSSDSASTVPPYNTEGDDTTELEKDEEEDDPEEEEDDDDDDDDDEEEEVSGNGNENEQAGRPRGQSQLEQEQLELAGGSLD
ncbi:DNA polymerase epsilon noncatalytic subunit [Martiniozyma asiatica (nom. inval.)]|nr:DNA polymerase epsilon noncatalytic subunit [Martiniozyma asiatica]